MQMRLPWAFAPIGGCLSIGLWGRASSTDAPSRQGLTPVTHLKEQGTVNRGPIEETMGLPCTGR